MADSQVAERKDSQIRVGEIDAEVSREVANMLEARRQGRSVEPARLKIQHLTQERWRLTYG